jgi:hypothetical protein
MREGKGTALRKAAATIESRVCPASEHGRRVVAAAIAAFPLRQFLHAVADFLARQAQLVELLQVKPVFRAGAEPMPEAQGGIGCDAALPVDDAGYTVSAARS